MSFCDHLNINTRLSFNEPGGALVVEPHFPGQEADTSISAILVVATLAEDVPVAVTNMPQQPAPAPVLQRQQQQQQQEQPQPLGYQEGGEGAAAADYSRFGHEADNGSGGEGLPLQGFGEGAGFEADDREDGPQGDVGQHDEEPDPEQLPA